MVRPDVVAQKITAARTRLGAAHETLSKDLDDFLASERERDLAMFYLFLAIQECIDIAAHWVADEGWGPAEEAGAAFEVLSRHGVIDTETARELRGAVGLRNRIGHGYISVEPERVHAEHRRGHRALCRFLDAAARRVGLGEP